MLLSVMFMKIYGNDSSEHRVWPMTPMFFFVTTKRSHTSSYFLFCFSLLICSSCFACSSFRPLIDPSSTPYRPLIVPFLCFSCASTRQLAALRRRLRPRRRLSSTSCKRRSKEKKICFFVVYTLPIIISSIPPFLLPSNCFLSLSFFFRAPPLYIPPPP